MAEGKKLHGSDSAWDVTANAMEHASDMSALLRHNAAPSVAGNIMLDNATNWVSVDAIGHVPFVPTARGDLIAASATLIWQRIALGGTTGSFLRRDATDPGWSTLTLPNAAVKGDLLVATATNAIGSVVDVAAGKPLLSGGIGLAPAYAGWNLAGTAGQTYTLPSVTGTLPGGSGVAGQVAEWVTDTHTLQAAKLIGPVVNILTITNAAASTLALAITAGKTLTLTATDNFNLTAEITGAVIVRSATPNVVAGAFGATPGNARGTGAVDLQLDRNAAEQVASGYSAVVGGGFKNTASGVTSVVSGGAVNVASGVSATVIGGGNNTASGELSVACGWYAKAAHMGSFLFGDATTANFNSIAAGEFAIRARSGFRHAYDDGNYWTAKVASNGVATLATLPVGAGFVFTPPVTFSAAPTLSTMTAGSILFAGASGVVSQHNDALFWDNANERFGIGTAAPTYSLDIQKALASFNLKSTTVTNYVYGIFQNGSGVTQLGTESSIGGDLCVGTSPYASVFGSVTNTPVQFGTNYLVRMTILGNGNIIVGAVTDRGAKFAVIGLVDYANNAAAVAAGLTTGAFYTETGTNPKKVCVVT